MDRLLTMTTFARVVKYASFTAAAEDLGISRTLVSRHIADLETHLGIRLLNRTTRSVTPTQAGLNYHDLCIRVLGEIRSGEEAITAIKTEIEGEIAVLCPIWIGSFGVTEATAEFCAANPGVAIKLHFAEPSANPHDFLDQGYDLCIQPNKLRDSTIKVKKIGEIEFVLVAAPGYVAEHGMPEAVRDLAAHDCVAKHTDPTWVFKSGERHTPRMPTRYSSNSVFSLCSAAVAGLGIALLPDRIAARDLDTGKLVTVLAGHPIEARPLYVAYAPGGDVARRVRALITYLADWFRERTALEASQGRSGQALDAARDAARRA
jgi:DNA-binding transcriptional LysR family regulator